MPMGINTCIKWSMLELRGLLEDEDARVYFQRSKRHLGLHPYQLNNLNRALREILSSKVNFYDPDLHGLVLAYKNPKLLDSLGGILHDSYFIHVDIEADFYIFKPEIGCTLKGIVNKKAGNHLGVLVHKAFNVSILKSDENQEWLGDYVFVGQEVKFTVTHLDFKGKLPFIRGELIPDATMGQIFYDSMNNEESEEKPAQLCIEEENSEPSEKRKKKLKKIDTTLNGEEENEMNINEMKNGIHEILDTEESSDYRDKTKKDHSSKKKSKDKKFHRKNDALNSESSSDDRDEVKKHRKSPKKLINEIVNDRNSPLEDPRNDLDEMNESNLSMKKMIQKQIHAKNTILDSENSSDDSYNLVSRKKISRRKRTSTDSEASVNVKPQKRKSQNEETNSSVEEKPKLVESKRSIKTKSKTIEDTSKSRELGSSDLENTKNFVSDYDEPDDVISSSMRRSNKKRLIYSDDEDTAEIDVKPDVTVKKKKKKDDEKRNKDEKKHVAETEKTEDKSKCHDEEENNIKIEFKEDKKKNKNRFNAKDDNNEEKIERKYKEQESHMEEEKSKKKKKKSHDEEELVAENEPDASEFEFIKPNVDAFNSPTVKCKRKRRKTITEEDDRASVSSADNTPDGNDFFRDVRIKVEPESSDVEDFRLSRKRKKSRSMDEEAAVDAKKRNQQYDNFKIKQERNSSDIEDSKSDKKQSKRKNYEENSYKNIKVKTEPDASDIEESNTFKSEPRESSKFHKSTIIKNV